MKPALGVLYKESVRVSPYWEVRKNAPGGLGLGGGGNGGGNGGGGGLAVVGGGGPAESVTP
jgi:hypothetical protein